MRDSQLIHLMCHEYKIIVTQKTWKKRSSNAGIMLGHRLRRWPNITPTLDKRLMFTGH